MNTLEKMRLLEKIDKAFFTMADLRKAFRLQPSSLKKAVGRMVEKGILVKLARNVYVPYGRQIDPNRIASQMYAPYAYISFETALSIYGIVSGVPYIVTLATYKSPRKTPFFNTEIVLRRIKKDLFFGYKLNKGILIAEPEKAILDSIYLESKGLITINGLGPNLKGLSKIRLIKMSKPFPKSVRKTARELAGRIKR